MDFRLPFQLEEPMNPRRSLLCLASTLVATLAFPGPAHADDVAEKARPLRFSSILVDTHDDTTQRFFTKGFALGERKPDGSVDIPRMREGGMDAIFFSIWIDGRTLGPPVPPAATERGGPGRRLTGALRRGTGRTRHAFGT
jgi:hypothetical protein